MTRSILFSLIPDTKAAPETEWYMTCVTVPAVFITSGEKSPSCNSRTTKILPKNLTNIDCQQVLGTGLLNRP